MSAERHGKLRLRDVGLGFARTASAVPLTAEEFGVAARSLTIVFAAQAPHMPVALTGLTPETNHYVDAGEPGGSAPMSRPICGATPSSCCGSPKARTSWRCASTLPRRR
ncbi:SapC family protein [Siccirubricoccus deserti]